MTLLQSNFLQGVLLFITLILIIWTFWYIHQKRSNSLERQLLVAFISFAIISIVPVLTLFVWQTRTALTNQVGETFHVMAIANSRRLGEELAQEVDFLHNLSTDEAFFNRIAVTSETELTSLSFAERDQLLQERQQQWLDNSNEALFESILSNVASEKINTFLDNFPEHRQLLVTDRFGGLVAAGGLLPDQYYFGDESWWQTTRQPKLKDQILIQDNDPSSLDSTIQIAFTIQAPFTAVSRGVMQSILQIDSLETLKEATLPAENSGEILVVDKFGNILYRTQDGQFKQAEARIDFDQINLENNTNHWAIRKAQSGKDVIYSSSPLIAPPEYDEFNNLGWTIVIQQKRAQALATVERLTTIAIIASLLATIMAIVIGILITRWLTKPIENLTAVTSQMAQGNLETTATPSGPIEFQTLATSFNHMTAQLRALLNDLELEVAERKQAETQLKAYTIELERSNKELQDFAYAASHDLQEPLRKIQAFGNRLETRYANSLDDRGLDYLSRMQDAAQRMQILIINLLDYSRITTQAQPFASVNLNLILQNVLSDLEVQIEEVNGTIFADTLPTIEADDVQMRQLLQNLIGNALKFHPKDTSPIIKIKTHIEESQNKCTLKIIDNGIGFENEYADRVFALFQRLHGRSQYEGTGIGLAVCRKIVERHNGTITANSVPDEGATFTITLPIKQIEEIGLEIRD